MDTPHDPTVQGTVLMWASQVGKTEIENNVVGYFIDVDPAPVLMVQPTLEMAESWSKTRLAPMLRDCPCFRGKVRDPRSRDSGNTILSKTFLGGDIAVAGANAPGGLAMRPRRVVLMDEIDRFKASAGTEGDPCLLAEKRTESFWNAVIFKSSSPTVKGFSRIEKEFDQTDMRYWFCPCPKCSQHQTLKWRQVLWGKRRIDHLVTHGVMAAADAQSKFAVVALDGSDAVYACEHCHSHLSDGERVKMVRAGEWRATAPFKGKRGYHLNGIYSPFRAKKGFKTRLHQMVAQFLEADAGGRQTLKAWTNTFLAETFEEADSSKLEPGPLMSRAEDYSPQSLPEGVIIALSAVDVQKSWLQVEAMGLGLDDETWGIESKIFQGDPEQDDVWQDLSDFLAQKFRREDGIEIPITATSIDMRHKPQRVRNYIRRCGFPRVYPVYGVAAGGNNLLVTTRFNRHYAMRTYAVDGKIAKDTIFSRMMVPEPGARFMHWPTGQGYNEEYFAQLTAEVLKTDYKQFRPTQHYEKTRDRNEALDIRVYLLAAIDILKPSLTRIAKRLRMAPAIGSPASAPTAPKEYILKNPAQPVAATPGINPATGRRRIRVGTWGRGY
jgi:phage terminase large subunit GpA-like protein